MLNYFPEDLEQGIGSSKDYLPRRGHAVDVDELLETAKYIGEDSDLRVFHRFDKLRLFLILRLQRRLAQMTKKVEQLVPPKEEILKGAALTAEEDDKLRELTQNIEHTLRDYDNALCAQQRIERFPEPDNAYMFEYMKVLETERPKLADDLSVDWRLGLDKHVAMCAEEKSWIHRFIGRHKALIKPFVIKSKHRKGQKAMMLYSEKKIRHIECILINVTFGFLLVGPILTLSWVQSDIVKLCIVVGFLLLGAVLMSGVATSKNNSGLGVVAGYGALLVFFLGVKINLPS